MKKIFITIMILVLVIFAGCSTTSSERQANEEKVRKLAENMGVSETEIQERLKNMSDEELNNAAKVINEKGQIDTSKVFAEVEKEQLEETNKLMKNAKLKEISLDCVESRTTTNIIDGSIISLKAMGETPESERVAMNNLKGDIEIKIYSVKYEAEGNSYFKEYKKGELVKTINGKINDLMKVEQRSSLLGVSYEYKYLLKINDLDKNKLILNKRYFDDKYEYNYIRYPVWIDISYKEGDKEFREVLAYENYFGCELYQKEEQIDSNEPNNQLAYMKQYTSNNVKLSDVKIDKGYGPYDMPGYSEMKNVITGVLKNTGSETLDEVVLRVYFLDENGNELKTQDYTVISSYYSSLESQSEEEFSFVIEKDQPNNWGYKVNVEVKTIEFLE